MVSTDLSGKRPLHIYFTFISGKEIGLHIICKCLEGASLLVMSIHAAEEISLPFEPILNPHLDFNQLRSCNSC